MTNHLPSGLQIRELPAPKYYEVIYTQRWQGEEDIRSWNERALIVIDEAKGQFSATSGYGKFAYTWGTSARSGESLHGFLYTLGFDYFMDKASAKPHRIPDHDRTVRELRLDLLRRRREDANWPRAFMTKDRARAMWNQLEWCEGDYRGADLVRKLYEDSNWSEHFDCSDPTCTMEDPGLRRFWNELWRPFAENVLRHWHLIDKQLRPARRLAELQKEARYPIPRRRAICLREAAQA